METFTLKVIGFSRVFYEGEAVQVQLPIQDGSCLLYTSRCV